MELVDLVGDPDGPRCSSFEDLQWADDLSLEALTELARQTRDRPLLIIGAYRSNEALAGVGAPRVAFPARHPADRRGGPPRVGSPATRRR